jgi:steroid delta-isomerase-like uncharacterized protein
MVSLAGPDVVIREFFDELWNRGRIEAVDRLMAADVVIYGIPIVPDTSHGISQYKQVFRLFYTALSKINLQIVRTVTEGDLVVAYVRLTAVYKSNELGVEATGQPVDFVGFTMARVTGGVIVEAWNCYDFATFYRQLGVKIP